MPKERKPRFRMRIEMLVPADNEGDAWRKLRTVCKSIGVLDRYQAEVISCSEEATSAR